MLHQLKVINGVKSLQMAPPEPALDSLTFRFVFLVHLPMVQDPSLFDSILLFLNRIKASNHSNGSDLYDNQFS